MKEISHAPATNHKTSKKCTNHCRGAEKIAREAKKIGAIFEETRFCRTMTTIRNWTEKCKRREVETILFGLGFSPPLASGRGAGGVGKYKVRKNPRVAQSRILATGLGSQRFQNFFGRAGFPDKKILENFARNKGTCRKMSDCARQRPCSWFFPSLRGKNEKNNR